MRFMEKDWALVLVLVCMFVFSNTGFAQCKNGKCPIAPQSQFIQPKGDCPNGKCPTSGFVVPQGGVLIVQSGFIVPKGGLKSDCPNGVCDNCPCPKGSCEKGGCIGSAYAPKSEPVTSVQVSKGGPIRNLFARLRNR